MLETNKIYCWDCINILKTLPDNSIDSIVTDPPYELWFMGKSWDKTGIAYNKDMRTECLRVLKPWWYLLAFSGTRTYHRMVSAIEDVWFEVRDMINWCYSNWFPKSLSIWKAINKMETEEWLKIGKALDMISKKDMFQTLKNNLNNVNIIQEEAQAIDTKINKENENRIIKVEEALMNLRRNKKYWNNEILNVLCVAITENLKNIILNQSNNVTITKYTAEWIISKTLDIAKKIVVSKIKWNEREIIGNEQKAKPTFHSQNVGGKITKIDDIKITKWTSEWEWRGTALKPAHESICMVRKPLSEKTVAENCIKWGTGWINIDESRVESNEVIITNERTGRFPANLIHDNSEEVIECFSKKDWCETNASRFFKSILYYPKASKIERNNWCEMLEKKNNHPTVKPIALMEYLIKMVTRKWGIVLDPFAWSWTTLIAAKKNWYKYIWIELMNEYIPIIQARLNTIKEVSLF